MKIAFISYEFPPETGYGGIGTYTYQIAMALAERGHHVEVFSSSRTEDKYNIKIDELFVLHRVKATKRPEFSERITEVFTERNNIVGFDIAESPEYGAEGMIIKKLSPSLPMIVKLHTPLFLVKQLNDHYAKRSFKKRIKHTLGLKSYKKENDKEYAFTSNADAVCSPSYSLATIIKKEWGINNIDIVPNVFVPQKALLDIPASKTNYNTITYIGRLDVRKGLKSLVDAIPFVLKKQPEAKFRFIGGDGNAPDRSISMQQYIRKSLERYNDKLEFTGFVHNADLPNYLWDTDIVIIPSLWENFPYTCLEAMSAGKAIVASSKGGMKEILDEYGGILIDPEKPIQIAKAVMQLLKHDETKRMGQYNREKIKLFGTEMVNRAEQYYKSIISKNGVKFSCEQF
jgi:glycosyltransferase involved in cell wall biosynthesis